MVGESGLAGEWETRGHREFVVEKCLKVEVEPVFPHDQRNCLHVVVHEGRIRNVSTHDSCIGCYKNWIDVNLLVRHVLKEKQGVKLNSMDHLLLPCLPCLHQAAVGTLV